jgi:hypothetical protein
MSCRCWGWPGAGGGQRFESAAPACNAAGARKSYDALSRATHVGRWVRASRVIRGVDNRRPVPQWLRERLLRLRSISPVVDAAISC